MGLSDIIGDIQKAASQQMADLSAAGTEEAIKSSLVTGLLETAEAVENAEDIANDLEESAPEIVTQFTRTEKELKQHKIEKPVEVSKPETTQKTVSDREAKDAASKFEKRNPEELHAESLLNLLKNAKGCKSKEELLKLLNDYYPDPLLADEALDFLSETTIGDLKQIVQEAKEEFTAKNEKDIRAEKNIAQVVSAEAGKDIEARPKLRKRYLELIHTSEERSATELFLEYGKQFPSYKELRKTFAYFYRALGMDLKSQGPSIEKGLLHSIMQEVRKAQSGLGLYNFFRDRMTLITKEFERSGLPLPEGLTFEEMTTSFLKLVSERYPSLEKVLDHIPFGKLLDILGKIIVTNQFRDALPQSSTGFLFRSDQHKEELKKSILDALEKLEEELEELEETDWEQEDAFDFSEKKKEQPEEEDNKEPQI